MKFGMLAFLLLVAALSAPAFACVCVDGTTAGKYERSPTVVLVTVIEAREGQMPWPDNAPTARPAKAYLLKVRVLKAWKGPFHSGDVVRTWTPYYGDACGCSQIAAGARMVVFSGHENQLDLFSCTTSEPGRATDVAKEIESIVLASQS
jgi:hypothetical protein